ncbi:hypothetical protein AB432_018615 [Brevibacillus brevis]|uniref:Uncharacterized protein n=1 Tax=Brevibacillus brevis TaxID=1393 RepID=A0A2Z4MK67_BREBE|nr:hypothetical protein [Brevibacillus brevis]AWX56936.1 hypothetical protein AB432_018615 [Brevibacillus brevis]
MRITECLFAPDIIVRLPDNCPPQSSESREVEVFRVVLNNPPEFNDFHPHSILYPKIKFRDKCEVSAVSVFLEIQDAIKYAPNMASVKKNGGKFYIAQGIVTKQSGAILEDSKNPAKKALQTKSHVSWWINDARSIHESFKIIDIGGI